MLEGMSEHRESRCGLRPGGARRWRNVESSLLGRLAALGLVVSVIGCGGGGGGGGGQPPGRTAIGLEDLDGDGQVVILCFGDSLTAGVGDPSLEAPPANPAGYPARLPPRLAGKTVLPLVVIDDGVSAERTTAGLRRLRGDVEASAVDYVILLEGTNDVQDGHGDRALQNMQAMIDSVFQVGAQPLLGTITPSCCNHKNQLPESAILWFNANLRAIALNNSVPLIDFYAAFTGGTDLSYDPDRGLIHVPEGLHPTPPGYDLMATTAGNVF
jgi:lysophospholipase L1-like esterase